MGTTKKLTRAEHALERGRMPALLDRAVTQRDDDAFGHHHFASALQSLVEGEEHVPPYSIGLLGRWGTGKSTIKEIYLRSLADERTKDSRGTIRADRVRTITFNAWQ